MNGNYTLCGREDLSAGFCLLCLRSSSPELLVLLFSLFSESVRSFSSKSSGELCCPPSMALLYPLQLLKRSLVRSGVCVRRVLTTLTTMNNNNNGSSCVVCFIFLSCVMFRDTNSISQGFCFFFFLVGTDLLCFFYWRVLPEGTLKIHLGPTTKIRCTVCPKNLTHTKTCNGDIATFWCNKGQKLSLFAKKNMKERN